MSTRSQLYIIVRPYNSLRLKWLESKIAGCNTKLAALSGDMAIKEGRSHCCRMSCVSSADAPVVLSRTEIHNKEKEVQAELDEYDAKRTQCLSRLRKADEARTQLSGVLAH